MQEAGLDELFFFGHPDRRQTISSFHNEHPTGSASANASTRVQDLYPSPLGTLQQSGSWLDLSFNLVWKNSNSWHYTKAPGKSFLKFHSLMFPSSEKRIGGMHVFSLGRERSGVPQVL
jgi:hypothetical protein